MVDLAAFGRPVLAPDYVWFWYLAVGSIILKAQEVAGNEPNRVKRWVSQREFPNDRQTGGVCGYTLSQRRISGQKPKSKGFRGVCDYWMRVGWLGNHNTPVGVSRGAEFALKGTLLPQCSQRSSIKAVSNRSSTFKGPTQCRAYFHLIYKICLTNYQ